MLFTNNNNNNYYYYCNIFKIYIYIYIYTHTHTHTYLTLLPDGGFTGVSTGIVCTGCKCQENNGHAA